jgi:CelD/BcsL family acetyltransferase involved in cellulose biosynthesis
LDIIAPELAPRTGVSADGSPAKNAHRKNQATDERACHEVRVTEINDRATFAGVAGEWDALVERADDQVFYRHAFLRIWIDNFAPTERLRVLTARDGSGRLVAALPLVQRRASLYGLPVSELAATANVHSCRFDLVAEDPAHAGALFFDHLIADSTWDVLRLTDVPEGGAAWRLFHRAEGAGLPTGCWESLQSPYVELPDSFEALSERLQAKFKANLRRRRKKLQETGAVTLELVEGGADLEEKLEEGLCLERSGWKGQRGTAITQDRATRGFYGELARAASQKGQLALYFLRVNGKAVAFHYALRHEDHYLLLKPAYDEAVKECSPGQLLMEDVLKECTGRRLTEMDFLGPNMTWKQDWTDKVRRHTWLFVFRRSFYGKLLREVKFSWVPKGKELVSRWKR